MIFSKRSLGAKGEDVASKYLRKTGYRLLHRNYRCPLGEIDIIAKDQDSIVFIEVKTKTSRKGFSPMDNFDLKKQRKVLQLAKFFLATLPREENARIDLLLVEKKGKDFKVDHFRDVIQDMGA